MLLATRHHLLAPAIDRALYTTDTELGTHLLRYLLYWNPPDTRLLKPFAPCGLDPLPLWIRIPADDHLPVLDLVLYRHGV